MTAPSVVPALLLLSVGLLLWPVRAGGSRLPSVLGSSSWPERLPVPAAVVASAGLAAALVSTPLVAVLVAAGAAATVLVRRRARRTDDEEERVAALTEALSALAAELRSGRPLEEAAAAAGAACGDSAGAEAVVRAVRAPASFAPVSTPAAGAWEVAVARVAAAVRLSVRTGCSLAAVVGAVEDDLRARRRHRLELRSALAGPRASAALLAGLPVLALLMGSGVGADPWRVLTTTGTGQVLLVLGVALEAAGLAWTARLVARVAP